MTSTRTCTWGFYFIYGWSSGQTATQAAPCMLRAECSVSLQSLCQALGRCPRTTVEVHIPQDHFDGCRTVRVQANRPHAPATASCAQARGTAHWARLMVQRGFRGVADLTDMLSCSLAEQP